MQNKPQNPKTQQAEKKIERAKPSSSRCGARKASAAAALACLSVLSASLASISQAQTRESLLKTKSPSTDLATESRSLSLQTEASVQAKSTDTPSFLTISAGTWSPTSIQIRSRDRARQYQFHDAMPVVGVNFEIYPLNFDGQWGMSFGTLYGYKEQRQGTATALHVLVAEAALAYRMQLQDRQWIIPFVKAGYDGVGLVQRGLEDDNTSLRGQFYSASLGFDVPLNRVPWFESRLQTALRLQYQNTFGKNSRQNWNGDSYSMGVNLTL
jgi:hypothetical protein